MLSLAVIAALSFTVNTYAEELEALPLVLPKTSEQGIPAILN